MPYGNVMICNDTANNIKQNIHNNSLNENM